MNQVQTYTRCEYFTFESCPHRITKSMNALIDDLDIRDKEVLDFNATEIVDKMLCNSCDSFEYNQR